MPSFRKIISIFFAIGIFVCTINVSGDVHLARGLMLRTDYSGQDAAYLKSIIRLLDRYARDSEIKGADKDILIICGDGKYFGFYGKNRLYLPGTAHQWQYDFAFRRKLYAALAAHRYNYTLPDDCGGVAPWIARAIDAELDTASTSGKFLFANRSFPLLCEFAGYYGTLPDFAVMCRLGDTDDPLLTEFIAEQGRILLRLLAQDGKIKDAFEKTSNGGEADFFIAYHTSSAAAQEYYANSAERFIWNQYRPMPGALAQGKLAELDVIFVQQLDDDGKIAGDYLECSWRQLAEMLRKGRPDAYRLRGKLAAAYHDFGKMLTTEENLLCAAVSAAAKELGKDDSSNAAFEEALTRLKNSIAKRIKIDRFFRDTLLLNTPLPDNFFRLFEAASPRNRVMSDAELTFLVKTLNNYLQ